MLLSMFFNCYLTMLGSQKFKTCGNSYDQHVEMAEKALLNWRAAKNLS